MNLHALHVKWQQQWEQAQLFASEVDAAKPKFFLNSPYPYVNGLPHLGHLFTYMRTEAFARYKRMQGFNVLFPQGWHATGSPIVSAAKLVAAKDAKQLQTLRDFDVAEEDLAKFSDAQYWTTYFPPRYKTDFEKLGFSIDWRREFITTEAPQYKAFIAWQFLKLKEKGYVRTGKFPVVWDPVDANPVGDHARSVGEGVVPQEFTLIKHKRSDGSFLVTATLRPETILGVTNLFVHPEISYVLCKVDDEEWIVSAECAEKLSYQDKQVTILGDVLGSELIGQRVAEFSGENVLVLPAFFCDATKGTGMVHSVPTDSPDDYVALFELQQDAALCEQFGLSVKEVAAISLLPVLDTPGFGNSPAQKVCEEMKITSQKQAKEIQAAKEKIYKVSFYESTLNDKYTTKFFSKDYSSKPVVAVKDEIKAEIVASPLGDVFYELPEPVVSRSKNNCLVKIVADQWFLAYGDVEWKLAVKKCLDGVTLYPEKVRAQFLHVVDWLHDWACTREQGLGTRLPWDSKWLIESLSDSTIYMAYYTIAHLVADVAAEQLDEAFFDWVFLGRGSRPRVKNVKAMRESFLYWYPVDFRNSGKDLVQNHLTFFMFNHVAIFDKKFWPKGIGVNGWVTADGQKMSKSLGNMIPLRRLVEQYSPDACRLTILNGGEDLDDPNWDSSFARGMDAKFVQLFDLVSDYTLKGVAQERAIDRWFASALASIVVDTTAFMERTNFRSAIQRGYFDLQRAYKWYMRRCSGDVYSPVVKKAIEVQILLLAPFCPHICEELWSKIGKKDFVSVAAWPTFSAKDVDASALASEQFVRGVLDDVRSVLALVKFDAKTVTLFVADEWMYDFVRALKRKMSETRDVGALIKASLVKGHEKHVSKLVPQFVKNPAKLPAEFLTYEQEMRVLRENVAFFSSELGLDVVILKAEDSSETKATQALPGKPAIFVS